MLAGTLFALAAGLLWGLVFIGPLLLPQYPAALQSFGRYLAFGLIALPLALWDRAALRQLSRRDWLSALELALVGNVLYYFCLATAIQKAGAPVPTMIIGTLPVVIAVTNNWIDGRERLPWARLALPLLLIACGLWLVHRAENTVPDVTAAAGEGAWGMLWAVGAVLCWTWYPIRNARWLRAHAQRSPRAWATAQGVATLPLALVGYLALWAWALWQPDPAFTMPLGPQPLRFVALMLAIGLLASWLGTLCWNEASQRLPTTLSGQLIVFETLAALAYAYALRGQWPPLTVWAGVVCLVCGVGLAVRAASAPRGAA